MNDIESTNEALHLESNEEHNSVEIIEFDSALQSFYETFEEIRLTIQKASTQVSQYNNEPKLARASSPDFIESPPDF